MPDWFQHAATPDWGTTVMGNIVPGQFALDDSRRGMPGQAVH